MKFKYQFMLFIAAVLSCMSSIMTALGMTNLFSAAGMFILSLFIIIDLGRFILFNFTVNEWNNLRSVKYFICIILALLFCYSGAGIYAKLDSLIAPETRQAMIDMAKYLKEADNAIIKHDRSEDLAKLAQEEYKSAMDWNRMDYDNCIARANKNKWAENKCNNTKRALDNKASIALKEQLAKADNNLQETVDTTEKTSKNKSEIASILSTICKFTQTSCNTYDHLQNALTILILLVIIGTDFLQIAIVLAVHTRKNKNITITQNSEKRVYIDQKSNEKCAEITPKSSEKCVLNLQNPTYTITSENTKKLPRKNIKIPKINVEIQDIKPEIKTEEIQENSLVENIQKQKENNQISPEKKAPKKQELIKRKKIKSINFNIPIANVGPKPRNTDK